MSICHQLCYFPFFPKNNHYLESGEFCKFLFSFYIVFENKSYDSYYNYPSTYWDFLSLPWFLHFLLIRLPYNIQFLLFRVQIPQFIISVTSLLLSLHFLLTNPKTNQTTGLFCSHVQAAKYVQWRGWGIPQPCRRALTSFQPVLDPNAFWQSSWRLPIHPSFLPLSITLISIKQPLYFKLKIQTTGY